MRADRGVAAGVVIVEFERLGATRSSRQQLTRTLDPLKKLGLIDRQGRQYYAYD
jgi:hypothetical protein